MTRLDANEEIERGPTVGKQPQSFQRWLEGHAAAPGVSALHEYFECLCASELERARRKLDGGAEVEPVLEEFTRRLTNKVLHAPTKALSRAERAERAELLALMRPVFGLPGAAAAHKAPAPFEYAG
jgi:glutamyl-tRNA reductase